MDYAYIGILVLVIVGALYALEMGNSDDDIVEAPRYKEEPKPKEATRVCNVCEEEKPMSHFAPIKVAGKMRTRRTCRACLEELSNG